MGLYDNIAKIFQAQSTVHQPVAIPNSEDEKRHDETYVYYGTRICGKVTASLPALSPLLQKVYNAEKHRQITDEEIQRQHKENLLKKLEDNKNGISRTKAEIANSEIRIKDISDSISGLNEKLIEAKDLHGEVNKMAKVKMNIGLVIIAILTIYLFLFYSSTFYSAFFRVFDYTTNVGDAMFDPQAIPNALSIGFGCLMFIICAPIIFMGLGYGLHFFMQQESWFKYIKAGSVIIVTFVFDCILAYLIAKKIYDIDVLTRVGLFPEFSIKLAIHDVNVWAVIFCGFIVYIIWGIVFDMILTAYEDIRSNKKEILKLEESIQRKKNTLSQEKQQLTEKNANLASLENKEQSLLHAMSQTVHYDPQIMRAALSDFFSGWMTMMNGLSRPKSEQDQANQIYNSTINQLFN